MREDGRYGDGHLGRGRVEVDTGSDDKEVECDKQTKLVKKKMMTKGI